MTRKLRVLTLLAGLAIGETGGGSERFGIELARHLDRHAFEPVVCGFWQRNLPTERYWLDQLEQAGVSTFFAVERGAGFSLARFWRGLANIRAHLRSQPVDIIHSHFQVGTVSTLLLKGTPGTRAVLRTAHGAVRDEWTNNLAGRLCRQLFTRWLFPILLDGEAGVSEAVVRSLDARPGARLAGKRARLVYNSIAPGYAAPQVEQSAVRAEFGLSAQDFVVGSVGRLSEQKGYTYLLQAVPSILARCPDVKILLVGDGELRASLEAEAARLDLRRCAVFAGARTDVSALYRAMDLFVLPSLWEGLPTVILESMANGVPVVATNIPGTRELIEDGRTGWLAQARNPASLSNAIVAALRNPGERAARAQRAAEDTLPRFSIERTARAYEAWYAALAK
jgi:glycosyltransferase involved in cell wall biosynthesis